MGPTVTGWRPRSLEDKDEFYRSVLSIFESSTDVKGDVSIHDISLILPQATQATSSEIAGGQKFVVRSLEHSEADRPLRGHLGTALKTAKSGLRDDTKRLWHSRK